MTAVLWFGRVGECRATIHLQVRESRSGGRIRVLDPYVTCLGLTLNNLNRFETSTRTLTEASPKGLG